MTRQEGGEDGLQELADFERSRRRSVAQQQSVWGNALLLAAIVAATILVTTFVTGFLDRVFCISYPVFGILDGTIVDLKFGMLHCSALLFSSIIIATVLVTAFVTSLTWRYISSNSHCL